VIKTKLKDTLMINLFFLIMGGVNFLRCIKILLKCHLVLSLLPSLFLPCKNTFMDDYDEILNHNSLKYSHSKYFCNL
jgi:hypothetical protein